VIVRSPRPGEEIYISGLIKCVFDEFIAPGYSAEGVEEFVGFIEPRRILGRIDGSESFGLVAVSTDKVIGYIEIRENRHISLLFVDKANHGQGVGTELFCRALERCRLYSEVGELTVNSSPYAVPIYRRFGFKETGLEQERNGIRFIPMFFQVGES